LIIRTLTTFFCHFSSADPNSIEGLTPPLPTIHLRGFTQEIPVNAAAQKKASNEITTAEKKLTEFEQIYNLTTDSQLRHDMYEKIIDK
jgi:hypothetical protein